MSFLKEYAWLVFLIFGTISTIIGVITFVKKSIRKHKRDSRIKLPTDEERIKYGTPLYLSSGIIMIILAILLFIIFMKVNKQLP